MIVMFLVFSLLIPVVGIWILNWRARRRPIGSGRFYALNVAGSKVFVSGQALGKLLLILLSPLGLPFLIILIPPLLIFWPQNTTSSDTSQTTQSLLEGLKSTTQQLEVAHAHIAALSTDAQARQAAQSLLEGLNSTTRQLEAARAHIEALSADTQARQTAIEESERVHQSLSMEIEHSLREVDAWRTLTAEQKAAFIGAAHEVLNRTSTIRVATVAIWSVLLNIVASAAWSLMGAPGQVELQRMFNTFWSFFGG